MGVTKDASERAARRFHRLVERAQQNISTKVGSGRVGPPRDGVRRERQRVGPLAEGDCSTSPMTLTTGTFRVPSLFWKYTASKPKQSTATPGAKSRKPDARLPSATMRWGWMLSLRVVRGRWNRVSRSREPPALRPEVSRRKSASRHSFEQTPRCYSTEPWHSYGIKSPWKANRPLHVARRSITTVEKGAATIPSCSASG